MKEKGKTKSEKVRKTLLFTCSLLLFTFFAANVAQAGGAIDRLGVCSWTWHADMETVLQAMEADGRYNGMQLALAPWLGIGDQESVDAWGYIKTMMESGELNVMSTMVNFPKEDYSTLSSITNTLGYMYGVAEKWPDADEQWQSNLFYTAKAAKLTKELYECHPEFGPKYLTAEFGFICVNENLAFERAKEICATCQVYNVTFLIESGPQHSQYMTNLLTRLNAEGITNVGVNFDPGDTELFGAEDPVESYKAMKPWIRQIHVKDCMFFGLGGRYAWNEDCVWGDGVVSRLDFGGCQTFLNAVKADFPDGINILYERITGDPALMSDRKKEVKLAMDRIIAQMTKEEGEPGNPWSVGAERGTILAYTNGETVVFSGHGTMRDFESAAPWGTGVTAAEIGPQVGTIGANAFAGCDMRSLTMRGNPPPIGAGNDFSKAEVHVRADALAKFQAAEGWKDLDLQATVPVPYDLEKGVRTLAPFLHEIWFTEEYDAPTDNAYTAVPDVMPGFSCTSVRNGNYYGRNMDYYLSDVSSFVVHMPAKYDSDGKKIRLASVGVASQNAIREDGVTNGLYTASYDTLPEMLYDGVNECGVIVNNNVVPRYDCGTLTGTNPEGEPLHVIYLIRYVLDHATNAEHAVELIKGRDLVGMAGPTFQLHWMVGDPQGDTYVVEVIDSKVVARKMDINSNFNWNWDNEKKCAVDDAYVAAHEGWTRADYPVPYAEDVDLDMIDKYYTPHADGVERFCIMREHYAEGATFEGMFNLLRRVQYTLLGEKDRRPLWLADLSGGYPLAGMYGLYKTNEVVLMSVLDSWFATNRLVISHKEKYRKTNTTEWQTVHNTTYDFKQQAFRIAVQEDYEHTFDVFLVERGGTKDDPWLVGKEELDGVKAYKSDDGTLVIEGQGSMRDFHETSPAPWGTDVTAAEIGAQIKRIGANAFKGCTLGTLRMHGSPPAVGEGNRFAGVKAVVREDAVDKFRAAEAWWGLVVEEIEPVAYDYQGVVTLAPFLHEVKYTRDYQSRLDGSCPTVPSIRPAFSCSAVRQGNFLGRNFDAPLDDCPTFIVRMPAKVCSDPAERRLASIGVAQQWGMREDGVTNGQYTVSYDILPEMTWDGINECGVVIEQNVVPRDDCGESEGTGAGDDLHMLYVPRFVLDHATSAAHAVELIRSRNIVGKVGEFKLHWMVADKDTTYVVELIGNEVVARKMDIMTNFNLNWDNATKCAIDDSNAEASGRRKDDYPVPYSNDVSVEQIDAYYTPYSQGVGRFAILREHYAEGATFEGMYGLMRRVQYSLMTNKTTEALGVWLSDFSSENAGLTVKSLYELYKADPDGLLASAPMSNYYQRTQMVLADKEKYRKANTGVWQTVHNTTYDIGSKMFRIAVQEDYENAFDIVLVLPPKGSEENPWAIGAAEPYDVLAWTNGTGTLLIDGSGAIGSMPWAESPAGITRLVKAEGVGDLERLVGSLPDLTTVNGLTLEDFGSAIRGFVRAGGFSAIEIKNGEAKLDVVIGRSDALGESAEWTPVSTNTVEVPAPGEQGFFIVVPANKAR